jgi:hypothetical protein
VPKRLDFGGEGKRSGLALLGDRRIRPRRAEEGQAARVPGPGFQES